MRSKTKKGEMVNDGKMGAVLILFRDLINFLSFHLLPSLTQGKPHSNC